jgi:glycosyltransferase involved in cell wall biosynthesis
MPSAKPTPADGSSIEKIGDSTSEATAKIGDLAASVGLRRIHLLAWRDLDDVEAGGSELHAAQVARIWAEAGLEVTMRTSYASGNPTQTRRDGYRVIRRAGRYAVFPRAVGSEILGRHGPRDGLVEIWNGVPFLGPLWCRGPHVVWLHHLHKKMWSMVLPENPRLARCGELLERRLAPPLYRNTNIVTLSESSRRELLRELHFRDERVRVVEPGIDPRFSLGGPKSDRPLVLSVSRLMAPKRFDVVIRAAARVREEVPDLELVIVGKGEERPRLEALVRDLGAEEWVTLAGHVTPDELVALYRRAWVLTSASVAEGWGMTITEAAACGTPAVVSNIAGHADAVENGKSGLLVEGERELARGLADVLTDDQLRAELGRGALDRASRLTWHATAAGTMAALVDDARRRRGASAGPGSALR